METEGQISRLFSSSSKSNTSPQVGLEPTAYRLTADRSTTELLRIFLIFSRFHVFRELFKFRKQESFHLKERKNFFFIIPFFFFEINFLFISSNICENSVEKNWNFCGFEHFSFFLFLFFTPSVFLISERNFKAIFWIFRRFSEEMGREGIWKKKVQFFWIRLILQLLLNQSIILK